MGNRRRFWRNGRSIYFSTRGIITSYNYCYVSSQRPAQSDRWKYLREVIDRGKISWPAHAKTRNLRTYRNFIQQMSDLQVKFEGPYMLAEAPKEVNAHDDYCDSLSIALSVIPESIQEEVSISNNPFYDRRRS